MTYNLAFHKQALKEWEKLGHTLKAQFKKKLAERLENPHIPTAKLHGTQNRYKIKLRQSGYRLIYEVNDNEIKIMVIAIGKRDRLEVYELAEKRH